VRKFVRIVEAWIALLCACARFQAADPAAGGTGIAPSRWWLLSGRIPRAPLPGYDASDEHDEYPSEKDSRDRHKHCREPGSGVITGHEFSVAVSTIGEAGQKHITQMIAPD